VAKKSMIIKVDLSSTTSVIDWFEHMGIFGVVTTSSVRYI